MSIHPTAVIHPGAQIGAGVKIGPHAVIEEHVRIGDGCEIFANAYLTGHTTLGANNTVHVGALLGHWPQHLAFKPGSPSYLEIGAGNTFREYCVIHGSFAEGSRTRIGNNCYFMHQSHAGHDCRIGDRVIVAAGALLAGHVEVEDDVFLSGLTAVHQFCKIGRLAMIGGVSRVPSSVPPYLLVVGDGKARGLNVVGLKRAKIDPATRAKIKAAYQLIYHSGHNLGQALELLKAQENVPEVEHIIRFIESAKRSICGFHRRGEAEDA